MGCDSFWLQPVGRKNGEHKVQGADVTRRIITSRHVTARHVTSRHILSNLPQFGLTYLPTYPPTYPPPPPSRPPVPPSSPQVAPAIVSVPETCPDTGARIKIGGPIWAAPMHQVGHMIYI
jgi:hypothetical protein